MKDFNIDITSDSYFFVIESEKYDTIPDYQKKTFYYGNDDGEISNLAIFTDIKTCEILAIVCLKKVNAMDFSVLYDDNEYADLKKKVKASFITPKGVGKDTYNFISDFTIYYSKDMLEVIIDDESEPCFSYTDGRMSIYYDADYNLLNIIVHDLTAEEYESLKKKTEGKKIRI